MKNIVLLGIGNIMVCDDCCKRSSFLTQSLGRYS